MKKINKTYTAYIKTDNKKGYIHYEYGQGEQLLSLVKNINDATFYRNKDIILEELKQENLNINSIIFFERREIITTEFFKID